MDKKTFRESVRFKRGSLFPDCKSRDNANNEIYKVFVSSEFIESKSLFLVYVSVNDEVDTLHIINYLLQKGKKVAVPKCGRVGHMDFYFISSLDELSPSMYGIPEPEGEKSKKVDVVKDALCIVPGIAFDISGRRIGYGGGYYDRFIEKHSDMLTVGFCYDNLIYDNVPYEKHDRCVDYIITEKGFMSING